MTDSLLEPRNDLTNLPAPGEIIIYDYSEGRTRKNNPNNNSDINELTDDNVVRAVQWNIERAYKLDEIIELLAEESTDFKDHAPLRSKVSRKPRANSPEQSGLYYRDFDVIAIQEFDINCARSNYRNSALEMARALKMRCIFLCEFEELYSEKLRSKRTQGGGVHGNGILTWWDVERVEVIDHVEIFNWERDGDKLNEPRRGSRRSLACFLRHPFFPERKMIVYSVHLEVFCGIFGRLRQFSQILEHSRANLSAYPHQMILGDLNTMAHGLARFLPKYCCDVMRWRSVGWSEAEWWQRNLFSVTTTVAGKESESYNYFLAAHHYPRRPRMRGEFEQEIEAELDGEVEEEECAECAEGDCDSDCECETKGSETETKASTPSTPSRPSTPSTLPTPSTTSIFTPQELKNLLNPHFFCPFPVSRSKTVEMHGYSGKLDWMLLRAWRVRRYGFDNEGYARSDHKLLWCEVEWVDADGDSEDVGKLAHDQYYASLKTISSSSSYAPLVTSSTLWLSRSLFIGAGLVGITSSLLIYYAIKK